MSEVPRRTKMSKGRIKTYHPEKFKGLVISMGYYPPKTIAKAIGMNENTIRDRINGLTPWRYKEMCALWRIMKNHITPEQFMGIFFDVSVEDILGIW